MNLSAPFVCQFFLKPLLEVLPYVDYLFGNESEAAALAEVLNLKCTDLPSIARHLASLGKISSIVPRTVIITHGSEATHAVTTAGHEAFSVPAVPRQEIVDTNGAGDAFVGGFLSQLVQGKSLAQCIDAGHYIAQVIIRRSGVTFPADHPVHL